MKALFLVPDLSAWGGIQKYSRGFIDALRAIRVDVEVVERPARGPFARLRFVLRALFRASLFRPTIVLCAHVNFGPLAMFIKKLFGSDYFIAAHGVEAWDIRGSGKIRALLSARAIFPVSRFTKGKLIAQFPVLAERTTVVPNFVNGEVFAPGDAAAKRSLRERYGIPPDAPLLLTVSRLRASEGYKGYDTVIRSLPAVRERFPGVRYLLVGDGDDAPRVKRLVETMGLGETVVFAGGIPDRDLPRHYQAADVFVMPSTGEGFGIAFLEALACGTPVIGGNMDGSRDPLLDGELGLLIDPREPSALAKAVISVLQKKTARSLTDPHALRERVLAAYGLPKFRAKILEIFQTI